ncbi:MAG: translation initiation factor [Mariprofundaceae bacterium]
MSRDNRVVYSTEHGQIGKAMEKPSAKNKHNKSKKLRAPSTHIINPAKQGVRIRRESKGRGGKCVSVIDGLPLEDKGLKALLKKLKNQLGTGGTLKGGNIEIQGDHREKLLLLLEKEGHKAKLAGG